MRIVTFLMLLLLFCATNAFAAKAGMPASLTVPLANSDGNYSVSWKASVTIGATYILQEADTPTFTNAVTVYQGTKRTKSLVGRVSGKTYYYRVKAKMAGYTDSGWQTGNNGCAVPGTTVVASPPSITLPVSDSDGTCQISWGTSPTIDVYYVVEEAASPTFSVKKKVVYVGPLTAGTLTGILQNTTYYFRVKAIKAGAQDSSWTMAAKGVAVPGSKMVSSPTALTVPSSDKDGAYTVSWASTVTGASFLLEEATNSSFTQDLRNAYFGKAKSVNITGRSLGKTYYYRVRAVKSGLVDSDWTSSKYCTIPAGDPLIGTWVGPKQFKVTFRKFVQYKFDDRYYAGSIYYPTLKNGVESDDGSGNGFVAFVVDKYNNVSVGGTSIKGTDVTWIIGEFGYPSGNTMRGTLYVDSTVIGHSYKIDVVLTKQ